MALKQLIAVTALTCLAFTVVGCSSSSGSKSSSTTTTAKQAVCTDKDNLESSVKHLASPTVLTGGKSSITKALKQVQQNLTALRSSAKASLQPKIDDVKKSVDQLQTAVQGNGSISSTISKAGDAISKIGTSAGDLFSSLDDQCS